MLIHGCSVAAMIARNGGGGAAAVNPISVRFALCGGDIDGVTIEVRTGGAM